MAGWGPNNSNVMDYITIASIGNATDFGDVTTTARNESYGASGSTLGLFHNADNGVSNNTNIDKITIASTGNATDWGDIDANYQKFQSANQHGGLDLSAEFPTLPAAMGLFGGSQTKATVIQYINIASTGNTIMFGDLSIGRAYLSGGIASSTRAIFAGGNDTSTNYSDVIDFVAFSTKGKATDFGNLTTGRHGVASTSNSTRGITGGGTTGSDSNVIDYITISSAGDATDFGDLTSARRHLGALSSPTRAVWGGGVESSNSNVLDYVTISSTGNATDFGDLTVSKYGGRGLSSNTRGVFGAGNDGGSQITMDYITIASAGNATDFGDMTGTNLAPPVSSSIRGVFGALTGGSNVMEYITIASASNSTDFGDDDAIQNSGGSASNSHGGI